MRVANDGDPNHGSRRRMNDQRYVHPRPGAAGTLIERIANCGRLAQMRRTVSRGLPFPTLTSDVVNIVYATWLVDASRVERFLPAGATLWERGGRTPFTILTYRHGHFGPAIAGPLRRLFPSPLQSNWRLYLERPLRGAPDVATVVFVRNVIDNAVYALGTRVFSDSLPSHLCAQMRLELGESTAVVDIEPGAGSAPRLAVSMRRRASATLPAGFDAFGESWRDVCGRLARQGAAVMPRADLGAVALGTIRLPIDLDSIEPLAIVSGSVRCPLLDEFGCASEALCFHVPSVRFDVLSDMLL